MQTGLRMVVGSGVETAPGVHCQPGWHIWPISQTVPGKQNADVGALELSEVSGEFVPGAPGGNATHPVSRKARGQRRICVPRNREHDQTRVKLNLR